LSSFSASPLTTPVSKQKKKPVTETREKASVPAPRDVVMYEVFIRNFSKEGTINALNSQLSELKNLGVNVLWLMPIQPTGQLNKKGTYGSPYSISDYYAINPDFGTKADFRALVDSVHAKGMYIIIDEVANHTGWDSKWVNEHPDWYTHDSTGKIVAPVADWTDVADLNFDNAELRKELIRSMKYWVDSFNIDGYRCDVAGMVPFDWWKECIGELRKSRPLLMLAEGDDPRLYESGFDMTYGWEMYQTLKDVWAGKRGTVAIDSVLQKEKAKYPANYNCLRFITNHDENSWDDVPQVKFTSEDGAKAAFVLASTLPGVPLLYNGQEVGYATRINLFEKYVIDWSANNALHDWYRSVLSLHQNNKALKTGGVEMMTPANKDVLVYSRREGTDQLYVMVNVRNKIADGVSPDAMKGKKFRDLLSNNEVTVEDKFTLQPFQCMILKPE
jgi:glycosidase